MCEFADTNARSVNGVYERPIAEVERAISAEQGENLIHLASGDRSRDRAERMWRPDVSRGVLLNPTFSKHKLEKTSDGS